MSIWVGPEQLTVELIRLNGRPVLRVRKHGYHLAYCRNVAELATHVDLADLVELIMLPTG
ncbi:transposase [Sphaerisporangium aureirubrum]|uniref:Transposase n=1 Tax=Sphaerisporangium aureirubrum TaxID=1544736 RepID=A0ABW1NC87_9ACTN